MKLFILILSVVLIGCEIPPDFTKNPTVIGKTSWKGGAKYELDSKAVMFDTIVFTAADEFADVGDTIMFVDGVLKAVPAE